MGVHGGRMIANGLKNLHQVCNRAKAYLKSQLNFSWPAQLLTSFKNQPVFWLLSFHLCFCRKHNSSYGFHSCFNPKFDKVSIFWEGHKILRFVLCSASQNYGGDFANFCGILRICELYQLLKMALLMKIIWSDVNWSDRFIMKSDFKSWV